jgi:hypothetical protein
MGCNDASPIGVIGFQGALSPLVANTRKRAATAEFEELVSVAGTIRRERVLPLTKGIGGSNSGLVARRLYVRYCTRMMNTVCLLPDADCERVSARVKQPRAHVDVVRSAADHQRRRARLVNRSS